MESKDNTAHQSHASLTSCHLLCTSCKTTLHLNEEIFAGDGFLLKCPNCQYPVSIRNVFKSEAWSVSEFFGCKYIGKDLTFNLHEQVKDWISDSISFQEAAFSQDGIESTVESLDFSEGDDVAGEAATVWKVQKKNGSVLEYGIFNDIRLAIEEGQIIKGDLIVTTAGVKHPVETYPGTADLFGNSKNLNFSQLSSIHKKKRKKLNQLLPSIGIALSGFVVAALIAAWFGWPRYQNYQGEKALRIAIAEASPTKPMDTNFLLEQTRAALQRRQVPSYKDLLDKVISAYKANPERTDLLPVLNVLWIENAQLEHNTELLEKGNELAIYTAGLQPMAALPLLAQGMYAYYKGQEKKSRTLIAKASSMDLSAEIIAARFYQGNGEETLAGTALLHALETQPDNRYVLEALADEMEKQNKLKESIGYFNRLVATFPEELLYKEKLKSLLIKAEDFDTLESMLRENISKSNNEQSYMELMRFLSQQKKYQDVIDEAHVYLEAFPDSSSVQEVRFMVSQAETALYAKDSRQPSESESGNSRPQRVERQRRRRR